jgi:hypothetical protein
MLDTEPRVHLYNKQKVMLYENFELDISAYFKSQWTTEFQAVT